MMVATLAARGGGARVRLDAAKRAELPHVGVDAEMQQRLQWVERGRTRVEESSWPLTLPDPLLGWRLRPGVHIRTTRPGSYDATVTTNGDGLRGAGAPPVAHRAGVTRIAVFGCSQTFGSGVEDDETFSARLEQTLGPGVEVLNFGVPGYGTDQMLLRWERDGVRYAPDIVVLAFAYYHLNRNVLGFRFFAKPHFMLGPDGTLQLLGVPVPDPDTVARDGIPGPPWPLADHSVLLRCLWGRELQRGEAGEAHAEGPAWELARALIERFAATAHRQGVRMILLNLDEDAPWLEAPLGQLASGLGIEWADAGPELGALRGHGVRLRLHDDPPWHPEGHTVMARVLRAQVCARPALV